MCQSRARNTGGKKTTKTVAKKKIPACKGDNPIPLMRIAGAAANDANKPLIRRLTANADNFNAHTLGTIQAAAEAVGQQLMLRRLLAQQQSILETLNEGVIVCDKKGRIKTLNRYARQIFNGIDRQDRTIDELLRPQGGSLLTMPFCNDRELQFMPEGLHPSLMPDFSDARARWRPRPLSA